ncbi:MAG: M23 family metallopeptidase [Rhodospirillales bacterium]
MNEKTWTWPRPPPWSFAAALVFAMALPATAGEAETPFKLDMPLRCVAGETCWIVNYVDIDPTPGRRDYRCGWLSYDGHKGTDFAIRDLPTMRRGVAVMAAAGGRVMGLRDGMEDVNVKKIGGPEALKGKDCGNGVLIKHPGGWSSQYCHMRKGSIAVSKGDAVTTGQRLGLVGLSGRTEFPHLHITVRKDGKVVDPFIGLHRAERCSLGDDPLWKAEILAKLDYRSVHLSNAGFAAAKPITESVRNGLYRQKTISRLSPTLFLWVDIFWPRPGESDPVSLDTELS